MSIYYEPGKNYVPDSKAPLVSGTRNPLNADLFYYYSTFLESDEISLPVKAAIGVVLDADLKRIYKDEYILYPNPSIKDWADYYKTLDGQAKDIADWEIYAFEKFIVSGQGVTFPKATSMDSVNEHITVYNTIGAGISEYWYHTRRRVTNEKREEYAKLQDSLKDQSSRFEKLKQELLEKDPNLMRKRNKYMLENLNGYLGGLFLRHPLSAVMSYEQSRMEWKLRQDILKMAKKGMSDAITLIGYYDANLWLIMSSKNERDWLKKRARIKTPGTEHPLTKVLYSIPFKKADFSQKSLSHPLMGVIKNSKRPVEKVESEMSIEAPVVEEKEVW